VEKWLFDLDANWGGELAGCKDEGILDGVKIVEGEWAFWGLMWDNVTNGDFVE